MMEVSPWEVLTGSPWLVAEITFMLFLAYDAYRWVVGTYCVFNFQELEDVVRVVRSHHQRKGGQLDLPAFFEDIRRELAVRYPGHITPKLEWAWCHAGGCLWSFASLHVSLTEYVIFTGTGSGTDGLTGRHFARISDVVVHGNARYSDEHTPYEPIFFKSGDSFHLEPLETQSIHIHDEFWLLEYGRGFVPALLPFGLVGHCFSTLDWLSVLRTFYIYSKFMAVYVTKWPFLRTSAVPRASLFRNDVAV